MLVDKNFPTRSDVPVLHVHDIEGTVLAPIQAAPEDLLVPKKFADALPATTRVMRKSRSRMLCKCTPRSFYTTVTRVSM